MRDYARAHPYEDADPSSISAQAGMPETEQQQELGEQQPIFADESSAAASGSQPMQDVGQQSVDSPAHHAAKRTTDHADDGAEHKRLHGDDAHVSFPHGDVVPQTPVSEAEQEILDDIPFEGMMSPSKAARHGDDPSGVNLLGHRLSIWTSNLRFRTRTKTSTPCCSMT